MKRFLFLCFWLCTTCLRAAVPTLESFEPTQFATNNNRVAYKAVHTNDAGIIYPALPNSLTLVTNENVYGTFSLPAKVTLLSLGTNYLDLSTNSTWLLNSPTNDATQVIISLSAGQYQGQLLFLTSQNGSNSFTLPDLSEQWDVPGAYVDIQGDWVGTTNRGMILQYTAPDWIEMARFDPSPGGGGGTVLGGGSTPFLPYWTGPATLANSPIQRLNSEQIKIVSGIHSLTLGMGSGSGVVGADASLQITAGAGVLTMNGGQYLTPSVGGVGIVLGYNTNYYGGLFLGTNGLFGVYTDDGTQLFRSGVPVGGGASTTINPTDGFIPYRLNSTTFSNSPIKRIDATSVSLNTSTNILSTSGSHLLYTNSATGSVFFQVKNAASATATGSFGVSSGAATVVQADTGRSIVFNPDNSSESVELSSSYLAPISGTLDIGTGAAQWRDGYFSRHIVWNGATNSVFDAAGFGSPETVVTANIGSTYRRFDGGVGTSFYVKEANNGLATGWAPK